MTAPSKKLIQPAGKRRWLGWSKGYAREYQRHECRIDAVMTQISNRIDVAGIVFDISQKGCLFRPAQHYLLYRAEVPIQLHVNGMTLFGSIANTITRGYGIDFAQRNRNLPFIGKVRFT